MGISEHFWKTWWQVGHLVERVCNESARNPRAFRRRGLELAQLEERLLLSASPLIVAETSEPIPSEESLRNFDEEGQTPMGESAALPAGSLTNRRESDWSGDKSEREQAPWRELVFIDGAVDDYDLLVADLLSQQAAGREIDVVLLDDARNGIEQITEVLAGRENLDALHFVSHGNDHSLKLGNTWLNAQTFAEYRTLVESWAYALSAEADLLFYGCDLAGSDAGQSLLTNIHDATGAEVAASTDDTGYALFGGDWNLEYTSGSIETELAFSRQIQQNWNHVLNVAVDSASSTAVANQAGLTISHTTSGTNRLLLVGISIDPHGVSVSSITYNGTDLTFVGAEEAAGAHARTEIWALVAPDVGTHDVVIHLTGSIHRGLVAGVITFTGVDQSAPLGDFSGSSGGSTLASTTVNSAQGDLVFGVVQSHFGSAAGPAGDQTEYWDHAVDLANGSGTTQAGAASVTPSWSVGNADWAVAAVSVQAERRPVLTLPGVPAGYIENNPAVIIDSTATVADPDSANFDTGTLTVDFTANGTANDRLGIRDQGTGIGQIGLSGSNVTYEGLIIGTVSGGTDGSTPLVVTFNANASLSATQSLLRNITYEAVSEDPNTNARTVRFVLTDGDGRTSNPVTQTVNVVSENDAPQVVTSSALRSYTENAAPITIDPTLSITDPDDTQLAGATVRISGGFAFGEDVLSFTNQLGITGSWDAQTGVLTLTGSSSVANYQTALRSVTYHNTSEDPSTTVRTFEWIVNDGSDPSLSATRDISISTVNDRPTSDDVSAMGNEDASFIAITLAGSDGDGLIDEFRLTSLPANGTLYTDALLTTPAAGGVSYPATAETLVLYFVPDPQWSGTTSFQYVAWDAEGLDDLTPATATLTVTAVNDDPVIISDGGLPTVMLSIAENSSGVTTVSSTDVDGGSPNYSLTGGADSGAFSLDSLSGTLTFRSAPDFENPTDTGADNTYEVQVTVMDGNGGSAVQILLVAVTDDNDTVPIIMGGQSFSVSESANSGASVGFILASDADTVGSLQNWQITADNADGIFAINAATGEITIADDTNLDFETTNHYLLTLTVSDGVNTSASETVSIAITDENDNPPMIPMGQSFSVRENSANGTSLGLVLVTDNDTVGTLQNWQIIGGNADGIFAIGSATGELIIVNGNRLDFEMSPQHVLTLTVDDGTNTSPAETVVISIANLNEAPSLSLSGGVMFYRENAGPVPVDGLIKVQDPDAALLMGAIVQISGNYQEGEDYLVFQNPLGITGVFDAKTGTLVLSGWASAADYQTALQSIAYENLSENPDVAPRQVSFTISDGEFSSFPVVREVQIASVNDTPQVVVPADQATIRNEPLVFSAANGNVIRFQDVDGDDEIFELTLSASQGVITLSTAFGLQLVRGEGFEDRETIVRGTLDALNQAVEGLEFQLDPNANGAGGLSLLLEDAGHQMTLESISIASINVAPPPQSESPLPRMRTNDSDEERDEESALGFASLEFLKNSRTTIRPAVIEDLLPLGEATAEILADSLPPEDKVPYLIVKRSESHELKSTQADRSSESKDQDQTHREELDRDTAAMVFNSSKLFEQFDSLQETLDQQEQQDAVIQTLIAGTTALVAGSLSVGYMIWILRVGSLLTAIMSYLPAWMLMDPLPILDDVQDVDFDASGNEEDSLTSLATRSLK